MSESLATSQRSIAIMMAMLAASVVALLLFAWLTEEVFENDARGVDFRVRAAVHHLASPKLTATMFGVSLLGSYGLAALFVVAVVGFWMARRRRAAALLLLCMAGALVLNVSLKYAFDRVRPQAFFGDRTSHAQLPQWTCLDVVLLLLRHCRAAGKQIAIKRGTRGNLGNCRVHRRRRGLLRVYLGVHYPTDVIAGYLASAVWVAAVAKAGRGDPCD